LSALYEKYGSAIYGVITRIVKNRYTAEEVLQQTMLKAWNKMGDYDASKSSIYTWLNVIARSTSIDAVRLKRYKVEQKTDTLDPIIHDSRTSNINVSRIDIDRLTANLEPKYKDVLDKLYLEGYSQSEVAKLLDIPLGTVKTRIKFAIGILRKELENEKSLFLGMLLLIVLILLVC
jgi:RNA polymerase sigma-70 factor (ECF subfamily)